VIDVADVEQAASRLRGVALRTPLIENPALNEIAGGRVLLKAECFQVTGSFKIRGAYNLLSQLTTEQAARGVVAFSSGNHAQGVAAAARSLGIRARIVMPADAPITKLENTRRLGGEVITYDRATGDREAIAREIAAQNAAPVVPSFDHPHIMAGQGTVGLEIAEQCEAMCVRPDQVMICCGGGGLTAGSAVALESRIPGVEIFTVEPDAFDDTARSLELGRRVAVEPGAQSICDALLTEMPGELTFAVNRRLVSRGLTVSETEVHNAMRFAFSEMKLVLEPSGAVALAAVLAGKVTTSGRSTVAVLSGGNVDFERYSAVQIPRSTG